MLRRGSADNDVRALQVLLNARGVAQLRADGSFGPTTEAAVREAQLRAGRPITGAVTDDDFAAFVRYRSPKALPCS